MKKSFKILSILASIFLVLGGILFLVGFIGAGGNLKSMRFVEETAVKSYIEQGEVSFVSIRGGTADVTIVVDDTAEAIRVEYTDLVTRKGASVRKITALQSGATLSVKQKTDWFKQLFSFYAPETSVKLIVPSTRTIALQVVTGTGDIRLQGARATFASLRLEANTGDILLANTDVVCEGFAELEVDTGDIKIGNFEANTVAIETDTGDVEIVGRLQANQLSIEVDSGDVDGEDGMMDCQKTVIGTDTGDVEVKMAGKRSDYTILVETDTGEKNIVDQIGGERCLEIETDTGDIDVSFAE